MTATTIADPFAAPHEHIADQLEPFCDGDLDRFSDDELLYAYDVATALDPRPARPPRPRRAHRR